MTQHQLDLTAFPVNEQWRPVVGYEGAYEVSNHGRIRSLSRLATRGDHTYSLRGRILTLCRTATGYVVVNLALNGVKCPGMYDFDRAHNHVSNLEWCTGSENLLHAAQHGKMRRRHFTKLSEDDVRSIRARLATGEVHEAIASAFGVNRTVVTRINSGARWRWTK